VVVVVEVAVGAVVEIVVVGGLVVSGRLVSSWAGGEVDGFDFPASNTIPTAAIAITTAATPKPMKRRRLEEPPSPSPEDAAIASTLPAGGLAFPVEVRFGEGSCARMAGIGTGAPSVELGSGLGLGADGTMAVSASSW